MAPREEEEINGVRDEFILWSWCLPDGGLSRTLKDPRPPSSASRPPAGSGQPTPAISPSNGEVQRG